jgi:hypothetical protein
MGMPKIFISYRHVDPDQALAAELAAFLEGARLSVFVDTKIRVGQEWVEQIERELRSSQYFVVLLSEDSIRSDMVRREVKLAHTLKKAEQLTILPVRVGFEGELPYDLGSYLDLIQYSFWKVGEPFAAICNQILQEIQNPNVAIEDVEEPHEACPQRLRTLAEATELRGAPLPAADPRFETGAVGLDSPYYVRRQADDRVAKLVRDRGVTVLIKGPRQVGKTSLLARGQAMAKSDGQSTLYVDFQLIDEAHFASLRSILFYFAHRMAREFRTTLKPAELWDDILGSPESLTIFVEQAVLENPKARVTLCLDEVDRIFQFPFRNGFFAMLRAWHNTRSRSELWNRLNLLIGHSTEPALFIDDINQSPFNIGEVFRLFDFSRVEVERLNEINGWPVRTSVGLGDLMNLVGGHPYLIRQSLYVLRTGISGIEELKRVAVGDNGPFGDHLRRLLWALRDRERMRAALKQIIRDECCADEADFQRLKSAGLVQGESRQSASPRCDLYRQYFSKHL